MEIFNASACAVGDVFPYNLMNWVEIHPFIFILSFLWLAGFLHNLFRRAICTCGEHFFFWGFIESIFWFIVIPFECIKELF